MCNVIVSHCTVCKCRHSFKIMYFKESLYSEIRANSMIALNLCTHITVKFQSISIMQCVNRIII